MIPHHYRFAALAFVLLLAGCAHRLPADQAQGSDDRPGGAHFSKSQAIGIASRAAERSGAKLSEYAAPTASYRPSDGKLFSIPVVEGPGEPPAGNRMWVIHFGWGPTRNYPGGDFIVFVDDKTGRARVEGGM